MFGFVTWPPFILSNDDPKKLAKLQSQAYLWEYPLNDYTVVWEIFIQDNLAMKFIHCSYIIKL